MDIKIVKINGEDTDIKGVYLAKTPSWIRLSRTIYKFPLLLFSLEAYGYSEVAGIRYRFTMRARQCTYSNKGIRMYNNRQGDYMYKIERVEKKYIAPKVVSEQVFEKTALQCDDYVYYDKEYTPCYDDCIGQGKETGITCTNPWT